MVTIGACITSSHEARVDHCRDLDRLRSMPFKDRPIGDLVYDELITAGWEAVPCLIDRVTDARPMSDPRGGSGNIGLRFMVGSTAVLMLSRITNVPLRDASPADAIGTDDLGERPYWELFSTPEGRQAIQDAWWRHYLDVRGELPANVLDALPRGAPSRGDREATIELRAFLKTSPSRRLSEALGAGDERLLGVYGYSLSVPGVPVETYAVAFKASAILPVPGTSDVWASREEAELQSRAVAYAEAYNRLLLDRLRRRDAR